MKIALLQPDLSEKYKNQRQAYGSGDRPPETGLAVLDSWISHYGDGRHQIEILDPRKSFEKLSNEASNYDVFGMSDWFTNHKRCIELAKETKKFNPDMKVVFGGPNASFLANEIFSKYNFVDYIVSRDGEEALLKIVESKNLQEIPNLYYKDENENPRFTYQSFTSLKDMPVWDFSHFQNVDDRLSEYLKAQKNGLDPWLVPPVTLFSFNGCKKAMKEGVCIYCTSAETKGRSLPSEKLWEQVIHFNQKYGAETFYMKDDIFTRSPSIIEDIAKTKPQSAKSKIRAYGYLPDLARLPQSKLEKMAKNLQHIGVFNLFYGSENYDENVLAQINKRGIDIGETVRVIKTFKDFGDVGATMAYLFGLPRESRQSIITNINSFKQLLKVNDCIERLYISVAMPLKGTPWCDELQKNPDVQRDYKNRTGKILCEDDDPDYNSLSRLAIKYQTSITPQQVSDSIKTMIDIALTKIPKHKVGGFMLNI